MLMNTVMLEGRLANAVKLYNVNLNNGQTMPKALGSLVWSMKLANGKNIVYPVSFEAWGGVATTLANYTTKGSLISIQGELVVDNYNGNYVTRVKALQVGLLETKEQTEQRRANANAGMNNNAGYQAPAYNQAPQAPAYSQAPVAPQSQAPAYQAPVMSQAPQAGTNIDIADDDLPF